MQDHALHWIVVDFQSPSTWKFLSLSVFSFCRCSSTWVCLMTSHIQNQATFSLQECYDVVLFLGDYIKRDMRPICLTPVRLLFTGSNWCLPSFSTIKSPFSLSEPISIFLEDILRLLQYWASNQTSTDQPWHPWMTQTESHRTWFRHIIHFIFQKHQLSWWKLSCFSSNSPNFHWRLISREKPAVREEVLFV